MRALLLFMLLALSGCEALIGPPVGGGGAGGGDVGGTGGSGSGGSGGTGGSGGSGGAGGAGGGSGAPYLSNLDVYTRLKPTCAGCHTIDMRPFFADLQSFENLIVYDTRYVIPGDPDGSVLVGLLQGSVGRQMPPPPQDSFQVLDTKGLTQISLQEVKDWIRALPPRGADAGTAFEPVAVRRKTAEQIRQTLYAQLGLSEADFFSTSSTAGIPYRVDALAGDSYAVRSADGVPWSDPFDQGGTIYAALGGAFWLEGKLQNDAITPNMLQALVPVSQAWCRTAFQKTGNTAVLARAALTDTSGTTAGAAAIKSNIDYLYLRMLGEPSTAAEVDDLFNTVFVPYESKGAVVAWTAVCAALVRDPMWILY